MDTVGLRNIDCRVIQPYRDDYKEHTVLVCDTETIKGKPYSIQFYDGDKPEIIYVNEENIFDVYCDYVLSRFPIKGNLSVWFFYCQFDLPIIHYPYRDLFTYDNHEQGYGEFDFSYVTGKTWYGNHKLKDRVWYERDAFQYVFMGLEKIAKDLCLPMLKKERPYFLGDRAWKNEKEKKLFEDYAIMDVLVLWELVHWILGIHRDYNVGLSVSLADLCGKIFRKHYVKQDIIATDKEVTLAALSSYHGGKTEMYVKGPVVVKGIYEYDISSAYPYAMTQIGNFFDYEVKPYEKGKEINPNGLYKVNASMPCKYQPLYTHKFKRQNYLEDTWITGWELESCLKEECISFDIVKGFDMISHNGKSNGLSEYVWDFFKKKFDADKEGNRSKRLIAKLALNSLYGKFISRITEDSDFEEVWKGGIIFHPFIATLITGFVRGYVHRIEHTCNALHTSTDAFITYQHNLDSLYRGINGLGGLKKEYQGDVLLVRPKVYVIFDKLRIGCYHKFELNEEMQVYCKYCHAKVLKAATHGFYGTVQMLCNMWKGNQVNYIVNRMIRLKEAKRSRDPEKLPFVFTDQRRSLNVEWSDLTYL